MLLIVSKGYQKETHSDTVDAKQLLQTESHDKKNIKICKKNIKK